MPKIRCYFDDGVMLHEQVYLADLRRDHSVRYLNDKMGKSMSAFVQINYSNVYALHCGSRHYLRWCRAITVTVDVKIAPTDIARCVGVSLLRDQSRGALSADSHYQRHFLSTRPWPYFTLLLLYDSHYLARDRTPRRLPDGKLANRCLRLRIR